MARLVLGALELPRFEVGTAEGVVARAPARCCEELRAGRARVAPAH